MFNLLKATFINKKSGEVLTKPDDFTFSCEGADVQIDNENIKGYKKENSDNKITSVERVDKSDVKEHNSFNKDIIKKEKLECSSTTNVIGSNSLNKSTSAVGQNVTLSFLKEFDLFLKKYKENYDLNEDYTTVDSLIPIDNKSEEFVKDIKEHESFEHIPDFTNLCENSETATAQRNIETNEIIENNSKYSDDTLKLSIDYISSSVAEISKPYNNLDTENKFHWNKNMYHYEILDDHNPITDDEVEENKTIISISSESSDLSMDKIKIDPSVNYPVSFSNKIENDISDKFETHADCEGYNSSDFEFIDEQEACKGFINESDSNIKFDNNHNNSEDIKEHWVNKAGSSRLEFIRPESNTHLGISYSNSDSEIEEPNHIIPEGENLYELFAEPWATYNYQAENKSFFSNKAMHLDVNNFDFNVEILRRRHQDNDDVKQEATENAQKILSMYPVENTKRRRRF